MVRAHVIKNNTIVNTIVVSSIDDFPGLIPATSGAIGDIIEGGTPTPPPKTPPTREELIEDILRERYERETSDLEYNGLYIKQDRESRSLLANAFDTLRRGIVPSIEWTCVNGYLTLTADNIDEIELLGLIKIQASFDWAKAEIEALSDS